VAERQAGACRQLRELWMWPVWRPLGAKKSRWGDSSGERQPAWLGPPPPLFASWHADSECDRSPRCVCSGVAAGVSGVQRPQSGVQPSGRRGCCFRVLPLPTHPPPFATCAHKKGAPIYGSAPCLSLLCPSRGRKCATSNRALKLAKPFHS
jgi:hypothetical protein